MTHQEPNVPDDKPITLSLSELEQVYDDLAQGVDRAGEHSELFLAKLALLLAQALGDQPRVAALIDTALADLRADDA